VFVGGSALVLVAWFAGGAGVAVVTGTAGAGGANLVDVGGMSDADAGELDLAGVVVALEYLGAELLPS
jgi:hypothetical protein